MSEKRIVIQDLIDFADFALPGKIESLADLKSGEVYLAYLFMLNSESVSEKKIKSGPDLTDKDIKKNYKLIEKAFDGEYFESDYPSTVKENVKALIKGDESKNYFIAKWFKEFFDKTASQDLQEKVKNPLEDQEKHRNDNDIPPKEITIEIVEEEHTEESFVPADENNKEIRDTDTDTETEMQTTETEIQSNETEIEDLEKLVEEGGHIDKPVEAEEGYNAGEAVKEEGGPEVADKEEVLEEISKPEGISEEIPEVKDHIVIEEIEVIEESTIFKDANHEDEEKVENDTEEAKEVDETPVEKISHPLTMSLPPSLDHEKKQAMTNRKNRKRIKKTTLQPQPIIAIMIYAILASAGFMVSKYFSIDTRTGPVRLADQIANFIDAVESLFFLYHF